MTENRTDYLLQLYHSQIERGHCTRAAGILKLLSIYLPTAEIERLNEQLSSCPSPAQLRAREIYQLVKTHRIEHLVHFTQASNVCSILEYGLLPRRVLFECLARQVDNVQVNDPYRFDNHCNANCLSISYPNYRMFYHYQQQSPHTCWAVLQIKADVLWKMDCAFCTTNAASNCISSTPVAELKLASALAALFDDYHDGATSVARSILPIPEYFPTNPQAEVLVFGTIPVEYITAVHLRERDESAVRHRASWKDKGVPIRFRRDYFGPRVDYEYWQTRSPQADCSR